jgi:hypothetical protein
MKKVAMSISEIDKEGKEHLLAELDEDEALDALAHVDARYEAYRRAHPGENLPALPLGKWEQYLDWAIEQEKKESK